MLNFNPMTNPSQIVPRIPLRRHHILPEVTPECEEHVKDDGGAHREEGSVNEILTDLAGRNTHTIADRGADTESVPFYKILKAVHTAKLYNSCCRSNPGR